MFRELGPDDASALAQHYLALNPQDRSLRFGVAKSDEAVARYCATIDWRRARLAGYFTRNRLRGVIELSPPLSGPSRAREIAMMVAPGWRRRGIGKRLLKFAAATQGDSCDRFLFFWQPGNHVFPLFLTACGGIADRPRGLGWIELSGLQRGRADMPPVQGGRTFLGALGAL